MSRKEIDMHGLYCEQAETILDREIISAYNSGVNELIVIHGKGSGALRDTALNTLFVHKDKLLEVIKGENTKEIGDSGFLKVRLKAKEIVRNKYFPRTTKLKERLDTDFSYLETLKEKKEKGKKRYLNMLNNNRKKKEV